MPKNIDDIIIFIKNKLVRKGIPHASQLMHPIRDWLVLLSVFVVLVIILLFFSSYLFLQIGSGELFVDETGTGARIETIDRELLKDTLTLFEAKERTFQELTRNSPTLPDPSR